MKKKLLWIVGILAALVLLATVIGPHLILNAVRQPEVAESYAYSESFYTTYDENGNETIVVKITDGTYTDDSGNEVALNRTENVDKSGSEIVKSGSETKEWTEEVQPEDEAPEVSVALNPNGESSGNASSEPDIIGSIVDGNGQKIGIPFHTTHAIIANLIRIQVTHIAFAAFDALALIQYAAFDFLHNGLPFLIATSITYFSAKTKCNKRTNV